jgi:uncharacterized protein YndB with AHSA1/START domain
MEFTFEEYAIVTKPISEVFDAVYNPKKLSGYFTTGGASGLLEKGSTVMWDFADFPGKFPIQVIDSVKNQRIVLEWANVEKGTTLVEFTFESLATNSTKVKVRESGWKIQDQKSLDESYSHCGGWMQMLCCLKLYAERGINLREGFFK